MPEEFGQDLELTMLGAFAFCISVSNPPGIDFRVWYKDLIFFLLPFSEWITSCPLLVIKSPSLPADLYISLPIYQGSICAQMAFQPTSCFIGLFIYPGANSTPC